MKRLIVILSILLIASIARAAGPPRSGARLLGTFSSGLIYSFTSNSGNPVTLDDCGYTATELDLYVTVPGGDPQFIQHDQYLALEGLTYWKWEIPTSEGLETLYMYPVAGNQLEVWIYP